MTLLDLRQRAQTYTRSGRPCSRIRTFCRFGSKRRLVATIEWLRDWPNAGPLPQLWHTLAIGSVDATQSAELALQQRHARARQRRVAALVALAAPRRGQRLVHVVAGDHAESAGHAGLELDLLDPPRRLGADEVEVVGLAADHDAQAGDAVVAGHRVLLGGE